MGRNHPIDESATGKVTERLSNISSVVGLLCTNMIINVRFVRNE